MSLTGYKLFLIYNQVSILFSLQGANVQVLKQSKAGAVFCLFYFFILLCVRLFCPGSLWLWTREMHKMIPLISESMLSCCETCLITQAMLYSSRTLVKISSFKKSYIPYRCGNIQVNVKVKRQNLLKCGNLLCLFAGS